ncbi:WD40 repeat-like protein [Xylaria curta]|nr:WD40 repeat-like protein [Xylaria curta]
MTASKLDSFHKALKRFKKALPPNLVDEFSVCSLDDVRDICREIQDAHGRNGTLRHMRRLEPFIEAMEQFGKVIEMFANVNEIVCFIWGPIKFLLGVTRTHMNSFDKLLDVYNKLGNAIPGLLQYQTAFEKHPPLATVLEDYYADILAFHQEAFSVFRRPRWKELFHSTWKTFDSKFGPILQSMKNRRELLESEKGSATLYEVQRLRQDVLDIYAKERNRTLQDDAEKHRREMCSVREKLEAPNYRVDQEISTEDRYGHDSGTWIFKDPNFCSWLDKDTSEHSVLYVNGIPGAGKTTLMSVVIEKLLEEKRDCVSYFYFKQKQPNKESHNSSLRALLLQLVERDSTISDHLFEKISSTESVNLRSTKVLESLVKTALESYRISYIVLDGLDECAPNEAAKSVGWFLSLIYGGLAGTNVALRVLFCGQRDGTLDKLLSEHPSISLEVSGHVEDICQYCRGFARRIREKFEIPLEMEEDIIQKVTSEAKGMFLYARVVLENLWNQTRRARLKEEIEPGTFPRGMEKAYDRVAVRVFEMSSMAEREDAKKIMGWVICARRLLRWREIQSFFCIDPINGNVDYEERRLRVTCKELCGSLVDIHHTTGITTGPEDVIKIVHETAREYLIRRKWLDASLEHAKLAIFCSRYLTSEPFAYDINEVDIISQAAKGYYALQDYAVQFWFDHFQGCAERITRLDTDLYPEVMSVAKMFLVSYGLPSKLGRLSDMESHEEVARLLECLPRDGRERTTYLNIEHRTTLIRNALEKIDRSTLHPTVQEILTDLYGNIASYKCFGNVEDRKQHTNRHDRPFRCPSNDCFASRLGYDTRAKLDQHQKTHHPDPENDKIKFPKMATKKKATVWTAVTQGDLATISSFLDSGEDINKFNEGEPLIYIAAKYGHFEICGMLLQRGANVNLPKSQDGRTALHAAVVAGNLDIVHLLISHEGCHPDQTDTHGRSPFCEACALGHLDIVKLLLGTESIKTDLQPQRHPGCCNERFYSSTLIPLGYACGQGHFAVVQYLLQQGQYDLVDVDIIIRASRQGHKDIVGLLRPIMAELGRGLSFHQTPSPFKLKRNDWTVTFNPAVPPALDVELAHILQLRDKITCIQFSPDGKSLAIGHTFSVRIYVVATGRQLCTLNAIPPTTTDFVNVLCFSPDSRYLATGRNGSIEIYDISTRTMSSILRGEQERVKSLGFTHDGRTIASVDSNGTAQLWDIDTSTSFITLSIGNADVSAILPGASFVAAKYFGRSIQVWDIYTSQLVANIRNLEWGQVFAFVPNGYNLFSSSSSYNINMWELRPNVEQGREWTCCMKTFKGHRAPINSVALSSDSRSMLSGSGDSEARLWDCDTGETQLVIHGHKGSVDFVAMSPTDDHFVTGSSDGRIRIWDWNRI